jgi:hypothetical protein
MLKIWAVIAWVLPFFCSCFATEHLVFKIVGANNSFVNGMYVFNCILLKFVVSFIFLKIDVFCLLPVSVHSYVCASEARCSLVSNVLGTQTEEYADMIKQVYLISTHVYVQGLIQVVFILLVSLVSVM